MDYTKEELSQLHACLYDILSEIRRVCDVLNIKFVMLGGSAIGVHFWKGIIPFDDDIDIGMKRSDYELFLREGAKLLGEDYFLQWFDTDPNYPLFFAKVRRNDTLFVEEDRQNIDMHQGVFVDILPLDQIPDGKRARFIQRKFANIANDCFTAKSIWRYRWLGKCETNLPLKASFLNCLFVKIVSVSLSKKQIYNVLHYIQTFYNGKETEYYNTVPVYVDYIRTDDLKKPEEVKYGNIMVWVPSHLEDYLHKHYPLLKKHLSEEEQKEYNNHRPIELKLPI